MSLPPGSRSSVSVVVCTRNRAEKLRNVLESLSRVRLPDAPCELVVVDNGSTDHTREVVGELRGTLRLPVRYVLETTAGLSHARNRALQVTAGGILAFTDDDCVVDPDWLAALVSEFGSRDAPDVVGGRVLPRSDLGGRAREDSPPSPRGLLKSQEDLFERFMGANFAFRRRVAKRLGGFDPTFGAGGPLCAAEDTDFVYRARRSGFKVLLTPRPLVYHDHGRTSKAALRRVSRHYAVGRGGFYCKHTTAGDREALQMALREIRGRLRQLLKGWRDAAVRRRAMASLLALFRGAFRWLWVRGAPIGFTVSSKTTPSGFS